MSERLPDAETLAVQERLKSALWFQIGKLVDDETINLGVNATPQFIGSLTELVWAQLSEWLDNISVVIKSGIDGLTCAGNIAVDLESFANHAGRNTVKTDDVLLLARRNEGLESLLRECLEKIVERKAKKGTD